MKNYIQFIDDNGRDMIGSDGVSPYDGRLGLFSIVMEACKRYEKLKGIRPYISGYTIFKKGRAIYSDKTAFIIQKETVLEEVKSIIRAWLRS